MDKHVCGCHAPRDGQEFSGRTMYAPACRRAPPPASHTQCLPTAIPSHMCLSPAARTHTVPAHGDPQPHMCFSPAPPPEQNPRHSRPCAPARAAERRQHRAHTGTSGTTPHGKNESIARAGIERKHEWHDTARQKREHRTRWHHKQDKSGSIVCAHTNLKSHGGAVGTGPRWRECNHSLPK